MWYCILSFGEFSGNIIPLLRLNFNDVFKIIKSPRFEKKIAAAALLELNKKTVMECGGVVIVALSTCLLNNNLRHLLINSIIRQYQRHTVVYSSQLVSRCSCKHSKNRKLQIPHFFNTIQPCKVSDFTAAVLYCVFIACLYLAF